MAKQITDKLSITEAQALCFRNRIPFYTYRLPGSEEVVFGAQLSNETHLFQGFTRHSLGKGFMMMPFNPASWSFPYFIKADISFTNELSNKADLAALRNTVFDTPLRDVVKHELDHREYLEVVRRLISTIKRESLKKVVFSRTLTIPGEAYNKAPLLFERVKRYHQAFLFMVFIPGKSAWLGATPETFLKYDRDGFKTMALAGTQPVATASNPVVWNKKEMEEQQIVTDYIREVLRPIFTRHLEQEKPVTLQAGNVYHLCTRFNSDEQLPADEIDHLISQLHPTPAVCGFPRKRAMQLIADMELQERGYYAGLLGPVQHNGAFDLFVNLRSVELFNEAYKLYAGGGITSLSDPEKEWQETCQKADTLMSLIQEIEKEGVRI